MSTKKNKWKFLPIRVSPEFHKEIKGWAFHVDMPVNRFVIQILEDYIKRRRGSKIVYKTKP